MSPQVSLQVQAVTETLVALVALVGFLSSGRCLMTAEVGATAESPAAFRTAVGFLPGVDVLMLM